MDQKLDINKAIENANGQTITVLNGDVKYAPDDKAVSISGTINAPREFLVQRKSWATIYPYESEGPIPNCYPVGKLTPEEREKMIQAAKASLPIFATEPAAADELNGLPYNPMQSHCLVNRSEGTIELHINERKTNEAITIKGKLELSPELEKLKINTGHQYKPESLAKQFRLMRSIFPTVEAHSQIISHLRNATSKITADAQKAADDGGNQIDNFQRTVESSLPKSFIIQIPLLKGEPKQSIEVMIVLGTNGRDLFCELESMDCAELVDKAFDERIEQEVRVLVQHTTVIER